MRREIKAEEAGLKESVKERAQHLKDIDDLTKTVANSSGNIKMEASIELTIAENKAEASKKEIEEATAHIADLNAQFKSRQEEMDITDKMDEIYNEMNKIYAAQTPAYQTLESYYTQLGALDGDDVEETADVFKRRK